MLILQHISYTHPNKNLLFDNISLTINHHEKIALIGYNGSGKSTLLKLIAKELQPVSGLINSFAEPYYIPQLFGQYNQLTIGQALKVQDKLNALNEILNGNATEY
jgi:ATPase subunit of ABC transporter with duplicated ATPase domains